MVKALVDSPSRSRRRMGLFSVVTPRPEGDGRWQAGARWVSGTCEPAGVVGDPCDDDATNEKEPAGGPVVSEAGPVTVYGWFQCGLTGVSDAEAQDRAYAHLTSREEQAVEHALWEGTGGESVSLVGSAPEIVRSNGASLAAGLAALEGWLASSYGSRGVIHMDTVTASIGMTLGVIQPRSSGDRAETLLGTPIVVGSGYDGTLGPDGEDAGDDDERWVFATPALLLYRGESFSMVNDQSTISNLRRNDRNAIAERTFVVGWDACGTAAVLVDLADAGGGDVDFAPVLSAISSSEDEVKSAVSSSESTITSAVGSSETAVTDRVGSAESSITSAISDSEGNVISRIDDLEDALPDSGEDESEED